MDHGTPVLTEQVGDYEQQWYCEPPAPGVTFLVTDCAWSPDHKTRKVFAVTTGHGSERR